MTPPRDTKILHMAPSAPATENPVFFQQWQHALQGVKLLYLRRQYKQCTTRCTQLLDGATVPVHPMHETFLLFYAALSCDILARATHNLSTTKMSLLTLSKEYYIKATEALPINNDTPSFSDANVETTSDTSPTPSSPITPTDHSPHRGSFSFEGSDGHNRDSNDADVFFGNEEKSTHNPFTSNEDETNPNSCYENSDYPLLPLRPSPLRIRKLNTPPPPFSASISAISLSQKPTLHAQIERPTNLQSTTSLISFTASTSTWLRARALQRYTTHLTTFAPLISAHIDSIDYLIAATVEAQANRKTRTGRFADGEIDIEGLSEEEKTAIEKVERIERGRERGWRRERFVPDRYEALCKRALEEL
ncbi:MAG: hypothetical protein M1827_004645 [Pycnora praestabilis]|nr:MAG: hypothetical protein M1827_004645 [Pycnora praestabilis]